nr:ABC transporter permease subunit [uncultured Acetatifactor sp.]
MAGHKVEGKRRKVWRKRDIPLYIMAAPAVVLLLLFNYFPMGGLVLSFKKFNVSKGIFGSEWTGFQNFKFLFASTDAYIIVRNTLLYNIVFIATGIILALGMALLLSEIHSRRSAKVYQTIYMLPYFLSWAVVAIVVTAFLDRSKGFVNQIIMMMGGEGLINWYHELRLWPPLLVFLAAWKGVGYQTVLFLAVISGISGEYYEAAALDGASKLQQARYITLPHLRMIISINLIMSMGGIFHGDFGLFYTVTGNSGALYPVTNVIDTYIFNGLKSQANPRIDGAGHFTVFLRIVCPLFKAGVGTIGLFGFVGRWNDWFTGMLYIENPKLLPLQTLLTCGMAGVVWHLCREFDHRGRAGILCRA